MRLVFVVSIVSLTTAALSNLGGLADTGIFVFGLVFMALIGWHATRSDVLYQRGSNTLWTRPDCSPYAAPLSQTTAVCAAPIRTSHSCRSPRAVALTSPAFVPWECALVNVSTCGQAGTIRLYERYTGLEVVDRWRRVDGSLSDRVMQLVRPYGYYQGVEERERLHEIAEPALHAFMAASHRPKRNALRAAIESAESNYQSHRADRTISRDGSRIGGTLKHLLSPRHSPRRSPHNTPRSKHTAHAAQSSELQAAKDLIVASTLQRAWRERRSRQINQVVSGWLLKTASSSGPLETPRTVERLRELITPRSVVMATAMHPPPSPPLSHDLSFGKTDASEKSASLLAEGSQSARQPQSPRQLRRPSLARTPSRLPKVEEAAPPERVVSGADLRALLPMERPTPRFERWFVLDVQASTLCIYGSDDEHKARANPRLSIPLAGYVALLVGANGTALDGDTMIALLPRHVAGDVCSSPPGGEESRRALESRRAFPLGAMGAAGSMTAHAESALEGRSWYLKAKKNDETFQWLVWLRRAGAAASITVVDQRADQLPRLSIPPPSASDM